MLILLFSASNVCSQTSEICLTPPQAKRIIDTLNVVPKVRNEAVAWRGSSEYFKWATDTAVKANVSLRRAVNDANERVRLKETLRLSSDAETKKYKQQARRRGLVTVLEGVGLVLLGYLAVTR